MTALASLFAAAQPESGGFTLALPDSWKQGRTAYGGVSSAIALHAAMSTERDLPPLRSAQIAFVGPLSGQLSATATILRRGRNAAFVQADVAGEAGLGLRAIFTFMADLPSSVAHHAACPAPVAAPDEAACITSGPAHFFTGNFDMVDRSDATGPAEWLRWVRLREREGIDPAVELIAIADALPPAAFKLLASPAPVSSLTWQINLLARPTTRDGWFLLHARSDRAVAGQSSQRMTVWDAAGRPVADAMQAVAIFG